MIYPLINGTLIIFTFIAVMRALGDIFVALVIVFANNILKIVYLGYCPKINSVASIIDYMDGNLFYILQKDTVEQEIKLQIVIKAIYVIIELITKLQKDLEFTHNDLKSDNIFFKFINIKDVYEADNISFYLGDFESATIKINEYNVGNSYLSVDKTINRKKDLFILINSIYFSFNDEKWYESFFKYFPVVENIKFDQENFHKLYHYKNEDINDMYLPENVKDILDKNFKNKL